MATADDEEWAERVCSKEWKVGSRPCAWFKGGHDCNRLWSDFAAPTSYVIMICLMCNAAMMTAVLLRAYRRDPKNRAIRFCLILFACIAVQSVDINGDFDTLPLVLRFGNMKMIRFLVDCALFEVGVGHRVLLGSLTGLPLSRFVTRFELVSLQILTFLFAAFVSTAEILFVPVKGRKACQFKLAHVTYHLGTASTELTFCVYTLCVASAARSHVMSQQTAAANQTDASLQPARKAIKLITTQLKAIATMFSVIFVYTSYVVVSRAGPGSLCNQPSCTPMAYVGEVLWLVLYSAGCWLAVFTLSGDHQDLPDLLLQVKSARKRAQYHQQRSNRDEICASSQQDADDSCDDSL